jgi:hypothetical protein
MTMAKYLVTVEETQAYQYTVDADSPKEAQGRAEDKHDADTGQYIEGRVDTVDVMEITDATDAWSEARYAETEVAS